VEDAKIAVEQRRLIAIDAVPHDVLPQRTYLGAEKQLFFSQKNDHLNPHGSKSSVV